MNKILFSIFLVFLLSIFVSATGLDSALAEANDTATSLAAKILVEKGLLSEKDATREKIAELKKFLAEVDVDEMLKNPIYAMALSSENDERVKKLIEILRERKQNRILLAKELEKKKNELEEKRKKKIEELKKLREEEKKLFKKVKDFEFAVKKLDLSLEKAGNRFDKLQNRITLKRKLEILNFDNQTNNASTFNGSRARTRFTLIFSNDGNETLNGVEFTEHIRLKDLRFNSSDPIDYDIEWGDNLPIRIENGSIVAVWTVSELKPGETAEINYSIKREVTQTEADSFEGGAFAKSIVSQVSENKSDSKLQDEILQAASESQKRSSRFEGFYWVIVLIAAIVGISIYSFRKEIFGKKN